MVDTTKFSVGGLVHKCVMATGIRFFERFLPGFALVAVLFAMTAVTEVWASPNIDTITRKSPTSENTDADTLTWLITFTEPVKHQPPDNVDPTDFVVSGTTATLTVEPLELDEEECSEQWDATLSDGDLASLNGEVTLAPSDNPDIWGCLGDGEQMTHPGPNRTNHNTFVVVNDVVTPPAPVIGISAGSAVMEGDSATFTVTANPVPTSNLAVNLNVTQGGDFGVQTGGDTVIIAAGQRSATLTVRTVDDGMGEPDGSITVTVNSGQGYNVAASATATVTVEDVGETDNTDNTDSAIEDDPEEEETSPEEEETSPEEEETSPEEEETSPEEEETSPEEEETSPDREALSEIYKAAGGDGWTENDNWNSSEPIGIWDGVTTDSDNRVTELKLGDNKLSGTIVRDIGKLEKLRILYLNNNKLMGAIPVTELGSLSSLEELALWGNSGLAGVIPNELGKKVDRAVLRTLNEVNGGSGFEGWFPQGETDIFSYSDWSGVTVGENDRVAELDLSSSGLSGDVTSALSALLAIERLDLSDNADLEGELPPGLVGTALTELDISGTGICAPADEEFKIWLSDLNSNFTPNESCGEDDVEPASETGGGGCALASYGSAQSVYQFVLVVFTVIAILGCVSLRTGRNEY